MALKNFVRLSHERNNNGSERGMRNYYLGYMMSFFLKKLLIAVPEAHPFISYHLDKQQQEK
jgi:hypothetical protein